MSANIATQHVLTLRKLEKLCKTAATDFFNGKFETLIKYDQEKTKVLGEIISEDGVSVVNDGKAYDFINQIFPKDNSTCGRILDVIWKETPGYSPFLEAELSQMASDMFYSWTCGEDYVEKLLEIGKIILRIEVPKRLHSFVEEARRCFALDRHLAVCALSRTIIEAFLLHLCVQLNQEPERNERGHPKMGSVFEIVTQGNRAFKNKLHRLYDRTSRRIHGDKTIDRKKSKEIFQEVMKLVQDIYALNGL